MRKQELCEIKRQYVFSLGELKSRLGIKGDEITEFALQKGRSPKDVENRVSPDTDEYYILTKEGRATG